MAELHVEKKRSSNTMWIVLGVLLVALVAWMAMRGNDDNRTESQTTQGATTSALPATMTPVVAPVFMYT